MAVLRSPDNPPSLLYRVCAGHGLVVQGLGIRFGNDLIYTLYRDFVVQGSGISLYMLTIEKIYEPA